MAKKIVIMTGSPRKNSNSNALAAAFAAGAAAVGHEVRIFDAANADIYSGCHADMSCKERGRCGLVDDGTKLYDMMCESDVLVIVSPVYWKGFTSQIKRLIDRFYQFSFPKGRANLQIKETYLIASAGSPGRNIFDSMVGEFKLINQVLSLEGKGTLLCPGLVEEGAVLDHPEFIQAATKMGMSV